MNELLMLLALLMGVGAVAGVIAGLLGVGGGVILVPAFYAIFSHLGYESAELMQICLATSLATIIVTSARSVQGHHKKGAVDWGVLKRLGPFIVVGALVGVLVVDRLSSPVLQQIFGVVVVLVALYMIFGSRHWRIADELPAFISRVIYAPFIGVMAVLLGIGGGSFAVPMLTLHGRDIHRAVATSAGFDRALGRALGPWLGRAQTQDGVWFRADRHRGRDVGEGVGGVGLPPRPLASPSTMRRCGFALWQRGHDLAAFFRGQC